MSEDKEHTVRKGMTPGWALAWVGFIGGLVLFSSPHGSFTLTPADATNILLNAVQIGISLLK